MVVKEIEIEKTKLVLEVFTLAYLIQRNTDYCVWIRYSGHVDSCEIEIAESKKKWQNKVCETNFYNEFKKMWDADKDNPLLYLTSRRNVLKQILEDNDIPYSEMEEHVECVRQHYF